MGQFRFSLGRICKSCVGNYYLTNKNKKGRDLIRSVPSQCRDVNQLNPLVKSLLGLALAEMKKKGIDPLVVETYRTKERQYYLYGKGRNVMECTKGGMTVAKARLYADPKAKRVTWTLNSIHIKRKAVDIVPQRYIHGKPTPIWDRNDKQVRELINIMVKYGFEAGDFWKKTPDSSHFQIPGDYKRSFYKGCSPKSVTMAIQSALNKKGYGDMNVNGIWDELLERVVNRFLKANQWKTDGKIGIRETNKLFQ